MLCRGMLKPRDTAKTPRTGRNEFSPITGNPERMPRRVLKISHYLRGHKGGYAFDRLESIIGGETGRGHPVPTCLPNRLISVPEAWQDPLAEIVDLIHANTVRRHNVGVSPDCPPPTSYPLKDIGNVARAMVFDKAERDKCSRAVQEPA